MCRFMTYEASNWHINACQQRLEFHGRVEELHPHNKKIVHPTIPKNNHLTSKKVFLNTHEPQVIVPWTWAFFLNWIRKRPWIKLLIWLRHSPWVSQSSFNQALTTVSRTLPTKYSNLVYSLNTIHTSPYLKYSNLVYSLNTIHTSPYL